VGRTEGRLTQWAEFRLWCKGTRGQDLLRRPLKFQLRVFKALRSRLTVVANPLVDDRTNEAQKTICALDRRQSGVSPLMCDGPRRCTSAKRQEESASVGNEGMHLCLTLLTDMSELERRRLDMERWGWLDTTALRMQHPYDARRLEAKNL